ncbi:putative MFS transporter [Lineolata rhizophorae]|uniref:Putative MFS transporter n=1 Tax=Lineolata rhizophorae TaxID=578093 RepID=A0A6A6NPC7_9PEZI|nr:putative MFS transporter [Lineolata rhizophorae]
MAESNTIGDAQAEIELHTAGSVDHTEHEKVRSNLRTCAILLALSLSQFAASLNTDMLATAIPTISNQFHSAAGYVWISGAYVLASAAFGPIWAKLSDIWGRKPIILTALAWFFISTIICARAVDITMLIAGRALQGTSGAALFQMVTIIISDIFSMRKRTLFFGLLSFVTLFAGAFGPILGGIFTELLTWRWCFYINLLISGAAFLLIWIFLDVHNPRTKLLDGLKAIDWLGSLSIVGMTLLVLLGLDFGGVIFPWDSPKVICLILFGALCGVFFFFSEKRWAKYPVIPLRILSNKSNVASYLVCSMQSFVFIGAEFYLPLYFQSVKGESPLYSGILLVPTIVAEACASIMTGILIHRTGRYLELMRLGAFIMTVGTGLYINLGVDTTVGAIVAFQLVAGFGCGFLFEAPIIAVQANNSQDDTASVSAAMGTVRGVSLAVSIIVAGVVFQNGMQLRADDLRNAGLPPRLISDITDDSAANIGEVARIQDPTQRRAAQDAFSWSIRNMYIMFAALAFLALISSAFVGKHVLSCQHTETKTGLKKEKKEEQPPTLQQGA